MAEQVEAVAYVRRGGVPEEGAHGRAVDTVDTTVRADGAGVAVPVRLRYASPGPRDVVRLRAGAVRRQVPAPGTWAAEEEDRPYVELAADDLPWRYAPGPGAGGTPVGSVAPWLVLVVDRADRVILRDTADGAFATLAASTQHEHPLGEAHRWCHVQRPFGGGPGVARVLCCRRPAPGARFEPDTDHVAALVVPWDDEGRSLWPVGGGGEVTVRCLLSWRYRTGAEGGFGDLARQLHAADGDPIGTVLLARLPDGTPLRVPGALTTVSVDLPDAFDADLTVLAAATDGPPTERVVVGPPGYGAPWLPGGHDDVRALVDGQGPGHPATWRWPVEANADLRHRVVAGLGVRAGVELQEEIVAAAARSLGPGAAAAELVGGAALGVAATARLWRRRAPDDAAARLRLLGPALAGLVTMVEDPVSGEVTSRTLREAVSHPADPAHAPFPAAAFGPVLGRAVPAGGPAARHSRDGATGTGALVEAVTARAVPAPTPFEEHEAGTGVEDLDSGHVGALAAAEGLDRGAYDEVVTGVLREIGDPGGPAPDERRRLRPDELVGLVEGYLDPVGGARVRERLAARLDDLAPRDVLAPVEDCPDLDLPAWRWLRDRAPQWLLPGAEDLGPGEVVALRTNPVFVEAFLLGLNHQALAELRWRGHPVRDGCTPLRRFWDRARRDTGPRRDDVLGVSQWVDAVGRPVGRLGRHAPPGVRGEQLVVVVRSELFRRYPRTLLYLAATAADGSADLADRVPPETVSAVAPDLTMFAFDVAPDDVADRWVVVEEQPDGVRFWLEDRAEVGAPGTPDDGAARAARHVRRPLRVLLPGDETLGVGGR